MQNAGQGQLFFDFKIIILSVLCTNEPQKYDFWEAGQALGMLKFSNLGQEVGKPLNKFVLPGWANLSRP